MLRARYLSFTNHWVTALLLFSVCLESFSHSGREFQQDVNAILLPAILILQPTGHSIVSVHNKACLGFRTLSYNPNKNIKVLLWKLQCSIAAKFSWYNLKWWKYLYLWCKWPKRKKAIQCKCEFESRGKLPWILG